MRKSLKTFAAALALLILFSASNIILPVSADKGEETPELPVTESTVAKTAGDEDVRYWDLLDEYEQSGFADYTGDAVELTAESALLSSRAAELKEYGGKTAVNWESPGDSLIYTVNVPVSGLYNVEIEYFAYTDKNADIQRALQIDGIIPASEWNNLRLSRIFTDDGAVRVGQNGDEAAPSLKQIHSWQTEVLSDYNGYYSGPMKLYLTEGAHELALLSRDDQPVAIGKIRLSAPEVIPEYKEVLESYNEAGYTEATEASMIEGEDTLYRSSASLRQDSFSDISCQPYDPRYTKINIIGGSYWKNSRQTIVWEIEAPEDGLYQLSLHLHSYYNYGDPVFRRVMIDGSVPFKELEAYCVLPGTKWRTESLSDADGVPFQFYLTKGTHELSMSTVAGEMTPVIKQLTKDMDVLSALYLDITLVTTSDPDPNYDYQLENRVPGLMSTMRSLRSTLSGCAEQLFAIGKSEKGITYNQMKNTIEDLRILIDDVFEIPSNLDQFTTMLTQYGNWINVLKAGIMSVDTIELLPPSGEPYKPKTSFFERLWAGIVSFTVTFTKDYNAVIGFSEENADFETIDVWYGGTQIWAIEIQDLIESSFVPQNNINVKFKLSPSSQMSTGINAMLLAILTGTAPDVVLEAPSISDYAMRSQSYDLSQFNDFGEIAKRFREDCFTPLTYKGGIYGLPLTVNANVMFYRTDIFKRLGLTVPNTWEEMISSVIPKLAENSMSLSASPGYEALLFQMDGELYNEGMTETAVDSQISWKAFKLHCDFYTMYGVPRTVNFFNRFRSGETPVGFGDLAAYIQFIYAAPELAGRWAIAPMPGIRQEDGTINHKVSGLLKSSAMIMADAKNPEGGWSFLKWYTSTAPQVELSGRMEARLDMSARLLSANTEAFDLLDWSREDLAVLRKAMSQTKTYNPVLGNYYTERYINYAFNYVVVSKTMSEREAIEYAAKNINTELERRRKGN